MDINDLKKRIEVLSTELDKVKEELGKAEKNIEDNIKVGMVFDNGSKNPCKIVAVFYGTNGKTKYAVVQAFSCIERKLNSAGSIWPLSDIVPLNPRFENT